MNDCNKINFHSLLKTQEIFQNVIQPLQPPLKLFLSKVPFLTAATPLPTLTNNSKQLRKYIICVFYWLLIAEKWPNKTLNWSVTVEFKVKLKEKSRRMLPSPLRQFLIFITSVSSLSLTSIRDLNRVGKKTHIYISCQHSKPLNFQTCNQTPLLAEVHSFVVFLHRNSHPSHGPSHNISSLQS